VVVDVVGEVGSSGRSGVLRNRAAQHQGTHSRHRWSSSRAVVCAASGAMHRKLYILFCSVQCLPVSSSAIRATCKVVTDS
jgi:hypothetical protein